MKKKLSVLWLMLVLLAGMISLAPANKAEAAGLSVSQLQAKFPAGKYWNHAPGTANNPDGWTNSPCSSHSNCTYSGSCGCNSFSSAIQCMGFAYKLGYDAFGSSPRNWSKVYNLNSLKPGDVVRYTPGSVEHSVFVTAVNGNSVTIADCNYGSRCIIRWNVTMTKSQLSRGLQYVQVAPGTLNTGASVDPDDKEPVYPDNPVTPESHNPEGMVDYLTAGDNVIRLGGWAFDADAASESVLIYFTVGGNVSTPDAEVHYVWADKDRTDINKEFGITGKHGFSGTFYTKKLGKQQVYVYARNLKGGSDSVLWNEELTITDDPYNHAALQFDDVDASGWYYEAISFVYENGIMTGTSEHTFSLSQYIPRAQFTTILYRMNGSPAVNSENPFPDCSAGWYLPGVLWCYENRIVSGYTNKNFGPGDRITREQVAVILYRYSAFMGYDTEYEEESLDSYLDADYVDDFAKEAILWAVNKGIISGKDNKTRLAPLDYCTRTEAAIIIMNFMKKFG